MIRAEDVGSVAFNYPVGYLPVKVPEARFAMGRIFHVMRGSCRLINGLRVRPIPGSLFLFPG